MKKLKRFEIHVPIHETWVFLVEATDATDALNRYNACPGEAQQVYTLSGCNQDGVTEVKSID